MEIQGRSLGDPVGGMRAHGAGSWRYVSVLREIVSLCAACSEVDAMRRGVMPARYYPTCRRSGCLVSASTRLAGRCDVARGPPSAVPRARNRSTQPLPGRYRSSYLYIYIYVIRTLGRVPLGLLLGWRCTRARGHPCDRIAIFVAGFGPSWSGGAETPLWLCLSERTHLGGQPYISSQSSAAPGDVSFLQTAKHDVIDCHSALACSAKVRKCSVQRQVHECPILFSPSTRPPRAARCTRTTAHWQKSVLPQQAPALGDARHGAFLP